MSLIYHKTDVGNIGDDLNEWLWSQFFDLPAVRKDITLIGIGSIISGEKLSTPAIQLCKKKIFLGSGIRSVSTLPKIDNTWDLTFLRGPISSLFLSNSLDNYISDGAYALLLSNSYKGILNTPKKHKVSFMPYLRTSSLMPWEKICKRLGINYISPHPTNGIEEKLKEIAESEHLITEAMHGAILADVFRVPWVKLQFASDLFETGSVNETKWQDWSRSIEVKYSTYKSHQFPHKISFVPKLYVNYMKLYKNSIIKNIEKTIELILKEEQYSLSKTNLINTIGQKIDAKIQTISNRIY